MLLEGCGGGKTMQSSDLMTNISADNTVAEDASVKEILSEIPEDDAVMYLVNALSFEAEWQTVYDKSQIRDGEFTAEDGTVENVQMMYSEEYDYLETENATGGLHPHLFPLVIKPPKFPVEVFSAFLRTAAADMAFKQWPDT